MIRARALSFKLCCSAAETLLTFLGVCLGEAKLHPLEQPPVRRELELLQQHVDAHLDEAHLVLLQGLVEEAHVTQLRRTGRKLPVNREAEPLVGRRTSKIQATEAQILLVCCCDAR